MISTNLIKAAVLFIVIAIQVFPDSTETGISEEINSKISVSDTVTAEQTTEKSTTGKQKPNEVITTDQSVPESEPVETAPQKHVSPQIISEMESSARIAKGLQITGGTFTYIAVGLSAVYFNTLIEEDVGPAVPAVMTTLSLGGAAMSHTSLNITSKKATRLAETINDKKLIEIANQSRKNYLFGFIPMGMGILFTGLASPVTFINENSTLGPLLYTMAFGALISRDILWHRSSNRALKVFRQAQHVSSGEHKRRVPDKKVQLSFSLQMDVKKKASGMLMNFAF